LRTEHVAGKNYPGRKKPDYQRFKETQLAGKTAQSH
jgi:hypothetical protein